MLLELVVLSPPRLSVLLCRLGSNWSAVVLGRLNPPLRECVDEERKAEEEESEGESVVAIEGCTAVHIGKEGGVVKAEEDDNVRSEEDGKVELVDESS